MPKCCHRASYARHRSVVSSLAALGDMLLVLNRWVRCIHQQDRTTSYIDRLQKPLPMSSRRLMAPYLSDVENGYARTDQMVFA